MLGYLIYLLMSLGFAFATTQWQVIVSVHHLWRVLCDRRSPEQGVIADIELERRASAIGLYNFVTGLIYLPASLIAGRCGCYILPALSLWLHVSPLSL